MPVLLTFQDSPNTREKNATTTTNKMLIAFDSSGPVLVRVALFLPFRRRARVRGIGGRRAKPKGASRRARKTRGIQNCNWDESAERGLVSSCFAWMSAAMCCQSTLCGLLFCSTLPCFPVCWKVFLPLTSHSKLSFCASSCWTAIVYSIGSLPRSMLIFCCLHITTLPLVRGPLCFFSSPSSGLLVPRRNQTSSRLSIISEK